jgi:TolA-binding protein
MQNLNKKIDASLNKIETQKEKFLQKIQNLKNLNSAQSEVWTPLQITYHLATAERLANQSIKKLIEKDLPPPSFNQRVKAKGMNLLLLSNLKFKAPKTTASFPENLSYQMVKDTWDNARGELNELIKNQPNHKLSATVFKHPREVEMSFNMYINFVYHHVKHHYKQIK